MKIMNAKMIARIIVPYILFGSLWIILSDKILAQIVPDPALRMQWSIYKGWAYVFITGLLLTLLLIRVLRVQSHAFAALRESEQRFALIFNRSPLSITISRLRDNCYLDVNDSFVHLSGFSKQEVIGRTPDELNLWVDSQERERFIEQIKEKRRLSGIEMKLRIKAGEVLPVLFSGELIELDGEACMIAISQDISERNKVEDVLRRQVQLQDQLAQIASVVPGTIYSFQLNPDGSSRIPFASTMMKDIFGVPEEVLRENAAPAFERMFADDIERVRNTIMESARTMKPWRCEFRVRHPQKGLIWVEGYSMPKREQDGSILWHGFIYDVTERKQSEEEREHLWNQLNQTKKLEAIGQLAGGVAHDFNNILSVMMMRLELLHKDTPPDSEAEDTLRDFKEDIRRAADLTGQLLLFGRKQVLQIRVLDLNDVPGGLLKMLRRLLRENINFVLESSASPIWIEADHRMMEQVVMNLCINAQDAMPNGGKLVLSLHKTTVDEAHVSKNPEANIGEFACIRVADQGCGIDEATLVHIFEPFFTTKEVGKGTGLGLATVHGITKQHGGWVEVESSVGKGSTFSIYLPLTRNIPAPLTEEPVILPQYHRHGTILFVEDEANLRSMTANVLRRYGYTVFEAAEAAEALALWDQQHDKIELLITDMVMPGNMSGLELCRKLQLLKPDLKVVLSSGYSNDLLSQTDLQPQGIIYIPKPYDANKLLQTVFDLI
jgi:two-component system, cell cycle sensor histidine kinase and response regulator CckA